MEAKPTRNRRFLQVFATNSPSLRYQKSTSLRILGRCPTSRPQTRALLDFCPRFPFPQTGLVREAWPFEKRCDNVDARSRRFKEVLWGQFRAMELPILLLTNLPESAIRLVTQFIRKPHPCALLIKQLTFFRSERLVMSSGEIATIMSIETADLKWTYNFMYYIETGEPFYRPARHVRYAIGRLSEGSDSDSLANESDSEGSDSDDSEGEL